MPAVPFRSPERRRHGAWEVICPREFATCLTVGIPSSWPAWEASPAPNSSPRLPTRADFGFLGMVREPPSLIRKEVEAVRRATSQRFGVNLIPAATDSELLERQLHMCIDLAVPVVALFWELVPGVVERLRDAGILVVYQVGSAKEAETAQRAGAHILIAQGVEAGGHVRGTTPLKRLLSEVIAISDVPVLASGGIVDGRDVADALSSGADGVVIGNRLSGITGVVRARLSQGADRNRQVPRDASYGHVSHQLADRRSGSRAAEQRHAGSTRRSVRSEVRHR